MDESNFKHLRDEEKRQIKERFDAAAANIAISDETFEFMFPLRRLLGYKNLHQVLKTSNSYLTVRQAFRLCGDSSGSFNTNLDHAVFPLVVDIWNIPKYGARGYYTRSMPRRIEDIKVPSGESITPYIFEDSYDPNALCAELVSPAAKMQSALDD